MGLDDALDKTVWRIGRGAKKVKGVVETAKNAPKKAVDKAVARVKPTCVGKGGSLACKAESRKNKTCIHCGNRII